VSAATAENFDDFLPDDVRYTNAAGRIVALADIAMMQQAGPPRGATLHNTTAVGDWVRDNEEVIRRARALQHGLAHGMSLIRPVRPELIEGFVLCLEDLDARLSPQTPSAHE